MWATGATRADNGRSRTVGLAALAPLARIPGVRWFGLQKTLPEFCPPGRPSPEAEPAPDGVDLVRLGPTFADVADTVAALACLDLVITVDTSVGHMAGAIGAPTWVLLSEPCDPRWALGDDRGRTPLYPTMRLFRQERRGDWSAPVERVADELRRLAATHRLGSMPLVGLRTNERGAAVSWSAEGAGTARS